MSRIDSAPNAPGHSPEQSLLGRAAAYPAQFDPGLLYPIPRAPARGALGIAPGAGLPFVGHDRWHAYELSWLDARGKPQIATATLHVPADSPNLIESKSLKLYLNSCNAARFESPQHFRRQLEADLGAAAGTAVRLAFGLPPVQTPAATCIDGLELAIADYGPPAPAVLAIDPEAVVDEILHSALLKSNCPVTGQPDWADLFIAYRGPRIDPASLLRYLVGFREHAGFHEQCVEQIYLDLSTHCRAQRLSVEARYTRRGGLDINPWRATPGLPAPDAGRCARQ